MAESWWWHNIGHNDGSSNWEECRAYVNDPTGWVPCTPYVAGERPIGTEYNLRMGEYRDGHLTRGYDPYISPAWQDPGDLTPPYMLWYNVWRFKRSSSTGLITLKLTGGKIGQPESVYITEKTTLKEFHFAQVSDEEWQSSDQELSAWFDTPSMNFYFNDPDLSSPPMSGTHELVMGAPPAAGYWPFPNSRGYEPNDPEWVNTGTLTPDTFSTFQVLRFISRRLGRTFMHLNGGSLGNPSTVTVRFEDGQSFPFTQYEDTKWETWDEGINTLFFNNDKLNFYVDIT